jgi:hypothetical protein
VFPQHVFRENINSLFMKEKQEQYYVASLPLCAQRFQHRKVRMELLSLFQIISHFNFFRYIDFAMHLDITYI